VLACRACRVRIDASAGCGVCNPWRSQLVVVDAPGDQDRPALSSVSQELVNALQDRLRYYRAGLREMPTSETFGKGLVHVANAMTKLLDAARKLQDDGMAAVANMSFLERANLFIEWYAALPPAYRSALRVQMEDHERALLTPAPVVTRLIPAAVDE
jgi:hypothetical protein